MSKIIVSLSSNSDNREIDEYHDSSLSGSGTNNSSNSSSIRGNTTEEEYTSGVPRVSLEVFQEEVRTRVVSGSLVGTSTSVPLSASSSEEETVYCYAVGILSRTNEKKLNSLRSWYQILDDLTLVWLSVVNGTVTLILG